ncbi:putative glycosyltransferase [Methanocella paludicola SANAE]|uniref:Glycosyltransferase n=1 Tax=Methanocella paludicola (strain DSM 17711 / JCM 13418 / NBRC 101707 / SANAE) TaxID=304371 RepID=D1YZY1_METPS|nr:glycosyltransferase [Methanocella paludicola]BAI62003.1 putative glycosyltransferase [Methanocella paludicola SANAE]
MPTVSIIIPAYNQQEYIQSALSSVIDQTLKDWEAIIVNDGSTDNTDIIAQEFIKKDSRFNYIYQDNKGLSEARNTGLKLAKGKYVVFLDSDDILDTQMLELTTGYLEKHVNIDIVNGAWDQIDDNGKAISRRFGPIIRKNYLYDLMLTNLFPVHSLLIKKAVFDYCGFFDVALNSHEDWDMWLRALSNGYKMGYLNHLIAHYRIHPQSMTKNKQRMINSTCQVLDKTFKPSNIDKIKLLDGMPIYWKYQVNSCFYRYRYIIDSRDKNYFKSILDLVLSCVMWPPITFMYISYILTKHTV